MHVYKLVNEYPRFPPRELFTYQLFTSTEYLDDSLSYEYIQFNQEFVIIKFFKVVYVEILYACLVLIH